MLLDVKVDSCSQKLHSVIRLCATRQKKDGTFPVSNLLRLLFYVCHTETWFEI